ncbi:methyltransferase domain-containing protein [Staphylococcus sp. EG-SA-13]|nr:methyltransferase domain-containing protein [Staphylococcus sp. EG-SA-13]
MKKAGLGSYKSQGFEKWAKNFDANSFTEKSTQRTQRIMNWIQSQTGPFEKLSILDIGAASGIFSIPFAKTGAKVTSLEPSKILAEMLSKNANHFNVDVDVINDEFESINPSKIKQYDLVFASMCPVFMDWESVSKAINLSKKYVYISLMAGSKKNSLTEELIDHLNLDGNNEVLDMYYLTQILYFKDYEYQTLIEYQEKQEEMHISNIIKNLETWFIDYKIKLSDEDKEKCIEYLKLNYGEYIKVTTGGKFGKVLICK